MAIKFEEGDYVVDKYGLRRVYQIVGKFKYSESRFGWKLKRVNDLRGSAPFYFATKIDTIRRYRKISRPEAEWYVLQER